MTKGEILGELTKAIAECGLPRSNTGLSASPARIDILDGPDLRSFRISTKISKTRLRQVIAEVRAIAERRRERLKKGGRA